MSALLENPVAILVLLVLMPVGFLLTSFLWKAPHWGACLVVALIPFQLTLPWFSSVWVSFVSLGAFVLFVIYCAKQFLAQGQNRLAMVDVWVTLYLIVTLVSAATTGDVMHLAETAGVGMWLLVLYYAVRGNVQSAEEAGKTGVAFVLGAVAVSLYGLADLYTGGRVYQRLTQLGLAGLIYRKEEITTMRVYGTSWNPDYFGAMLNYPYAVALGLFLYDSRLWRRATFGVSAALLFYTISATGGRSASLGTVAGTLAGAFLYLLGEKEPRRRRVGVAMLTLLLIALVIMVMTGIPQRLPGGVSSWQRYGATDLYRSYQTRLGLWREGIARFLDRPLLGWGREVDFAWWGHAHSWYVIALYEHGALGLLSMLAVVVLAGWHALSTLLRSPDRRWKSIAFGSLIALVAFLVDGVANDSVRDWKTAMCLWVTIALAAVAGSGDVHRSRPARSLDWHLPGGPWRAVILGGMTGMGVLTAWAVVRLGELTYIFGILPLAALLALGATAVVNTVNQSRRTLR